MVPTVYNHELTKEEMEKIKKATSSIGKYGSIEIIKNGNVIDMIKSERIRIRDGKRNYHRG
jgi:hypothetical protein